MRPGVESRAVIGGEVCRGRSMGPQGHDLSAGAVVRLVTGTAEPLLDAPILQGKIVNRTRHAFFSEAACKTTGRASNSPVVSAIKSDFFIRRGPFSYPFVREVLAVPGPLVSFALTVRMDAAI